MLLPTLTLASEQESHQRLGVNQRGREHHVNRVSKERVVREVEPKGKSKFKGDKVF
jgi:hypothetical protein